MSQCSFTHSALQQLQLCLLPHMQRNKCSINPSSSTSSSYSPPLPPPPRTLSSPTTECLHSPTFFARIQSTEAFNAKRSHHSAPQPPLVNNNGSTMLSGKHTEFVTRFSVLVKYFGGNCCYVIRIFSIFLLKGSFFEFQLENIGCTFPWISSHCWRPSARVRCSVNGCDPPPSSAGFCILF
jgi:hypothetical protein